MVSFSRGHCQFVWTDDVDEAQRFFSPPMENVFFRDASLLAALETAGIPVASNMSVPHRKDILSLRALHAYGGFWADLDVLCLVDNMLMRSGCGEYELVLFTEHERRTGWKAKSSRLSVPLERLSTCGQVSGETCSSVSSSQRGHLLKSVGVGLGPCSVNLGLLYARQGSPLVAQAERELHDSWRKRPPHVLVEKSARDDSRHAKHWCRNQEIVQALGVKNTTVLIVEPQVAYGFPRWLKQWDAQRDGGVTCFGVQLHSMMTLAEEALCVNIWTGVWPQAWSEEAVSWWGNLPQKGNDADARGTVSQEDADRRRNLVEHTRAAEAILVEVGMTVPDALRVVATAIDFAHQGFMKLKMLGTPDKSTWAGWCSYIVLQASIKFHARDHHGAGGDICRSWLLQTLQSKMKVKHAAGQRPLALVADAFFINEIGCAMDPP